MSVTVGIDPASGSLVVRHAGSDSPAVRVTAPAVDPGQTLGRP